MNLKKLIAVGALLIAPQSFTNTIQEQTKEEIQLTLSHQGKSREDKKIMYSTIEISQELLNHIDTMNRDDQAPIVFSRSWEDIQTTPLVMKGTRKHIGEYLGYDQYDYILKTYNNDRIPDSLKTSDDLIISEFDHIKFPLIYDEIGKAVPHTLEGLLQEEKFSKYHDSIHNHDEVIVNMEVDGKRSLLYYKNKKLILATYTTIGSGTSTPRGLFSLDYKMKNKRSKEYNNAAMPYALHIVRGIFIHQGKVSSETYSHGCNRLPGLYAETLFYLVSAPDCELFYKAENNTLDSAEMKTYASLKKTLPKVVIID